MKTRMFAAAIGIAALSGSALAQATISLHTNQLPSQQGWQYQTQGLHAGTSETSAFVPGSSILGLNTMGAGLNLTSSYLGARSFMNESLFTPSSVVTIDLRARVVSSEVVLYHYGFGVSVQGGGNWMGFGLSTSTLTYTDLATQPATFDPTQWHDYRMVGNWSTGTFQMFVDNNLVRTANMSGQTMNANAFIGDSTGTANANVQIERFDVTVPSPAGAGVLAGGGLFAMRRRRK